VAVSARPQTDLPLDANGDPFNPHPVYTYSFQVADDDAQTYIAKQEDRDGDDVTGEYSYVDANGSLVKVTYTAGIMGYTEEREVTPNFVTIRSRPAAASTSSSTSTSSSSGFSGSSGFSSSSGFGSRGTSVTTVQSTPTVTVQSTPAVTETVSTTSTSTDNSALIQRILAQLTPIIQNTISGQTTTRRVTRPATVVRRVVPAVSTVTTSSSSSDSGVSGIFGTGGANNIRFTNPDTSYDFEFDASK